MVGLVATNQTEFTMDALPTCHGRPGRTRDIAASGYLCGSVVDDARVMGSNTALRCGFDGCETLWVCRYISQILLKHTYSYFRRQFHLECLNFEHAQKGWRCEH